MPAPNKTDLKGSYLLKLVLVTFSIIISCVIIEIFIRISGLWISFGPHERDYYARSAIDGVPYALKPEMDSNFPPGRITSNHDGYRTTIDEQKKSNVIRILAIGDSITFGFGVDQRHAYPQQLEAKLNKSNSNLKIMYEVFNAGVDGYNAEDEYYVLKNLITKYSPDLIIWLLVSNDWDDSLQVNENGQLITSHESYSVSSEFLRLAWGWTEDRFDPDNYYLMMDQRRRAWADSRPIGPEPLFKKMNRFLIKNYYTYPFVRSLFPSKGRLENFSDGELIYRNRPVVINGTEDFFPEIASITLSPVYNKRLYSSINKGVGLANANNIPIIIYGLNILLKTHSIHGEYIFEDISKYFSMPFMSFRQRYNLRWDGHLNSKGNKILAESVQQSLFNNKLVHDITIPKRKIYDTTLYWQQYKQYRKEYIKKNIKNYIDFNGFKGIHQLLGGLYPPRTFPIRGGATLALILKHSQARTLYISGNNRSDAMVEIVVQVGINGFESVVSIPSGLFLETVDLTRVDLAQKDMKDCAERIIDVRLNCKSKNDVIRMDYIGFDKPKIIANN